jgi:hypothetical protein
MWRDYLWIAAALLAVVNGVLAFLIAKLPARSSVFRLRLGALAIALGLVAAGTAVYARYQSSARTDRQQSERIETRKRLENLVLEGRALLGQIKDSQRELPAGNADEWAQRAEILLRDKIGERAVIRFRREVPELYGDDATVQPARLPYWKAVRNRTVNLEMIGAELGDTPLRK